MITKKVVIWDSDTDRISASCNNIHLAMQFLHIKLQIEIMSEPPLIARMGLTGRLPTLEINGNFWAWKEGEAITREAAIMLLQRVAPI
ncbi:hypothetical protein [Desulfovibrio desulfuricans]|uniref:hypothetical protein n=1 Tax=Desulfovibrio desulfuricans TaxID=876 RepID=UPI001454C602|nr:hypothetical protein [Desulfovibrio desulfuricans]